MFQTLKRLDGQRFGRWQVLGHAGGRYWHCRCDCGAEALVQGSALRGGRTKACKPCGTRENGLKSRHGMTKHPLHNSWLSMKSRCYKRSDVGYKNYGGRGIKVCAEWLESFEAFRDWAFANGFTPGLSIDRIDNDGGYHPANCRWATLKQQGRNRRTTRFLTIDGVTRSVPDWADYYSTPLRVVHCRIGIGWTPEAAVSGPYTPRKRNVAQGVAA